MLQTAIESEIIFKGNLNIVYAFHQQKVFNSLHYLSYSGARASVKLVHERHVWPAIKAEVAAWACTCLEHQKSKESCHTRNAIGSFVPPNAKFEHVHIDLVGSLPPSEGYRYCLTCEDKFSKCPEAM